MKGRMKCGSCMLIQSIGQGQQATSTKNTLKTIDGQMDHPPQHGLGMTGPGMRSVGLARPDQHAGLDRAYPQAAPTA
jgi:hypothetical protein